MPYPVQLDADALIRRSRDLIEAEGPDAASLSRLAGAFGVRAPSLYRLFASKADLLRAVNELTMRELVADLTAASEGEALPPVERLAAMAAAYRGYALAHPRAYLMAHSGEEATRIDATAAEALALPLQAAFAELVGANRAHDALRGMWAILHGFVSLQIQGQFRRPGDLERAFDRAIRAYLVGWSTMDGV